MWLLLSLFACVKADDAAPPVDSPTPESPPPDSEPLPRWYADADADGYGDPQASQAADERPPGYVRDNSDCDDTRPDVYPGAVETCDEADQDCDGGVDEDPEDGQTWYADLDQDGWGNVYDSVRSCEAVEGFISRQGDCDDLDPAAYAGAAETCGDGVDQSCDGLDLPCRPEGALSLADVDMILLGHAPGDRAGVDVQAYEGFMEVGDAALLITAIGATNAAGDAGGVAYLLIDSAGSHFDMSQSSIHIEGDLDYPITWTRFIGDINHDFTREIFVNSPGRGCILMGPVDGDRSPDADGLCVSPEFGDFADVVAVGDQSNDNRGDIVLSVSGLVSGSDGQAHELGRAYVFEGPASSISDLSLAEARLLPSDQDEQGRFGHALCSGDFNGDGVQDLAVGAPAGDEGLPSWRAGGLVYIALGPLREERTLDDGQGQAVDADGLWWGPSERAQAGEDLSCANDVDADGADDVLVGASAGNRAPGAAYLLLHPLGSSRSLAEADWIVEGAEDLQGLGAALHLESDLDRDGAADPVMSATGPTDPTFIWYGGALSGTTSTEAADAVLEGVGGSGFAPALAGGVDVEDNGVQDLLIAAPGYADQAGAVFVLFGGGAP